MACSQILEGNVSKEYLISLPFTYSLLWKYNPDPYAYPSFLSYMVEPYPISGEHYEQLKNLQPIWQQFFIKLSNDFNWLRKIHLSSANDIYLSNLLRIGQLVSKDDKCQKVEAVISRSDYIYDSFKNKFLMTEINLYAVGLWTMATKLQKLQQSLLPYYKQKYEIISQPNSCQIFIQLFQKIHHIYSKQEQPTPKLAILMVASGTNSDRYQQITIESELLLRNIILIKRNLQQLSTQLQFDADTRKITIGEQGYKPSDFANESEWLAKEKIELSRAIKIPNVKMHLTNFKNVQSALSTTNIVPQTIHPPQANRLKNTMAGFESLDNIKNHKQELIAKYGSRMVVKSIHQGSMMNYFGDEAIQKLKQLPQESIIVMEFIHQQGIENQIVCQSRQLSKVKTVSQVSFYGYAIYEGVTILENKYNSYMVRTYQEGKGEVELDNGTKGLSALCYK